MDSRKNAALTTEDRRWLAGEKSYDGEHAKQQRYQRRRDIRKRVYNTLLDFTLLFERLEADERRKLFGGPPDYDPIETDDRLRAGLRDALAFVLYNTGIVAAMESGDRGATVLADELLVEAIDRAGSADGYLVEDVTLSIDAEHVSQSSLLADLEAGRELSSDRLCRLIEHEDVDTKRVQEYLRTMLFEEGDR